MPTYQLVAIAVAAVAGGAVGSAVTVLYGHRARRASIRRKDRNLLARWLSARLTVSRASLSLVSALRSLAGEPRHASFHRLRIREVQRARGYWCRAVRELDRAESACIAWSVGPADLSPFQPQERIGANALRVAMDGDEADVQRLVQSLTTGDQAAIRYVHSFVQQRNIARRRRLRTWAAGFLAEVQLIVDQWARR